MQDYLVIGGGIAGLYAAHGLASHGSVLVLDMEDTTGFHCSGRSAALYEADYGAPATIACARISEGPLRDFGVLSPRGFLLVGRAEDHDLFERDRAALCMEAITPAEAIRRVPILNPERVAFAAFTDVGQDIDTDLLMQILVKGLRAKGGEIRLRSKVTALVRTADGWEVHVGDDLYHARKVVNAAGAWVDEIASLAGIPAIGFRPCRRSMAQIPAPAGLDVMSWPMVISAGETWYAKPQGGKLLVSPADEDPMEPHDAWADDMVLAEGLARYEEMVTEPVTRVDTSWAGLRTFAPDRALVLGPDPLEPSFLWCSGQGGQGFLSAPGATAALLELEGLEKSGLDDATLSQLSPARFR